MTYIRFCAALALTATLAFGQNIDSTRIRYTSNTTGAVQRILQSRLGDVHSVLDFGAKADGSDNLVAFQAASTWVNAGTSRALYFPDGTYTYTGGLTLTSPAILLGGTGAILNYTGSAHAVDFGPTNLNVSTFQPLPYQIIGLQFTGGLNMTQGIYFNPWLVNTFISGTFFHNFGNATAWNIYYPANNWYNLVDGVLMWSDSGLGRSWNGIRNNGASDNGQSRTIVTNTLIQSLGISSGTGIYLNSFNAQVSTTTVAGFQPLIQLGAWANNVELDKVYGEIYSITAPAIMEGDTGSSVWLTAVTVRDCFFNLHNSSAGPTSNAHMIGTQNTTLGYQNWRLSGNTVADITSGQPLVVENNLPGQTGNFAQSNLIETTFPTMISAVGRVHSSGSNISVWSGTDESVVINSTGTVSGSPSILSSFQNGADASAYLWVKAGVTTNETSGYIVTDYLGNIIGGLEACGSTCGNRATIVGPGNQAGLQVDSSGTAYLGKNSLASVDSTGKITTSGQIYSTSGGYKFPDNTTQTSAGIQPSSSNISTNTAVSASGSKNQMFSATGTITVTLYDATLVPGGIITVQNAGTGTITINPQAGQTINGLSSAQLIRQFDSYTLQVVNGNWVLI